MLLFCADPLNPKQPDPLYGLEVAAAEKLGLRYGLLNFEALTLEANPAKAVRALPESAEPVTAVYRGWMLKPADYAQLYAALAKRGLHLLNDPAQYRFCHYLPEVYALLADVTPQTVWLKLAASTAPLDWELLKTRLAIFGAKPLILKDYVKSRKHDWLEACFIPSANDFSAVERVTRRFLELQGADLNEGLVYREFVEFEQLTTHSKSGMPLTKEFRTFWLDGQLIYQTAYWDEGDYGQLLPPLEQFQAVAAKIPSRFFTLDIAKQANGSWLLVEPGDGQVSGLPDNADPLEFYAGLRNLLWVKPN